MDIFGTFMIVLGEGLKLWNSAEKTKYLDEYLKLKKELYEESNKPENIRDDAVLDNIRFRLCLIGIAFGSRSQESNTENQQGKA